jgi:hypothetical protein
VLAPIAAYAIWLRGVVGHMQQRLRREDMNHLSRVAGWRVAGLGLRSSHAV